MAKRLQSRNRVRWQGGRAIKIPDTMTPAEMGAILEAAGPSRRGKMQRAWIVMLWRAGLRVAEVSALRTIDLDKAERTVYVECGKGKKSRWAGLDAQAWEYIEVWLRERERAGYLERWPLFCTPQGERLFHESMWRVLKRLAKKAGVNKRVHPHCLRHTHAYELTKEGVPLTVIQQQLGHSSLAYTQIYTNHICPADVQKHVGGRTWEES
jgi:site-specific recombinase XerD